MIEHVLERITTGCIAVGAWLERSSHHSIAFQNRARQWVTGELQRRPRGTIYQADWW